MQIVPYFVAPRYTYDYIRTNRDIDILNVEFILNLTIFLHATVLTTLIWHYWTHLDFTRTGYRFGNMSHDVVVSLFWIFFLKMLHWKSVHALKWYTLIFDPYGCININDTKRQEGILLNILLSTTLRYINLIFEWCIALWFQLKTAESFAPLHTPYFLSLL